MRRWGWSVMIFTLLLLILPVCGSAAWDGAADTAWYRQDDAGFTLTTEAQLAGLSQLVAEGQTFQGATVTLGADLDLEGRAWRPIGNAETSFCGTFDGAGHRISGLRVSGGDYSGLFGAARGAVLRGVTVVDCQIAGNVCAAGLCAYGVDTDIFDCSVFGAVTAAQAGGGIAGHLDGTISGCQSGAAVTGGSGCGGIAGELEPGSAVRFSLFTGTVAEEDAAIAGNALGEITQCVYQTAAGYRLWGGQAVYTPWEAAELLSAAESGPGWVYEDDGFSRMAQTTLSAGNGPLVLSPDGYIQNGVYTAFSGAYRLTGSGTAGVTVRGSVSLTMENLDLRCGGTALVLEPGARLRLCLLGTNTLLGTWGIAGRGDMNLTGTGCLRASGAQGGISVSALRLAGGAVTGTAAAGSGIRADLVQITGGSLWGMDADGTETFGAAPTDGTTALGRVDVPVAQTPVQVFVQGKLYLTATALCPGQTALHLYLPTAGKEVVTKFGDGTISLTLQDRVLTGLAITAPPARTGFVAGERFDPAGMVVTASFGSVREAVTAYVVTPAEGLALDTTFVTVSYTEGGVTKTVRQGVSVVPNTLLGLEIVAPPDRVVYREGERFSAQGLAVYGVYAAGVRREVTGVSVDDPGPLTAQVHGVTVRYTEGGVTQTAVQPITVQKSGDAQTPVFSPPEAVTCGVGETCILHSGASVSDGGTLSYQWYRGGEKLSGATEETCQVDTSSGGTETYFVEVTNTVAVTGPPWSGTATAKSGEISVHICASRRFLDVPAGSWYHPYVDEAVNAGLVNGVSATGFAPQSSMSRAMVVTVLWRMNGSPSGYETADFLDVYQQWYRDAVNWAAATGVVQGVSEQRFDPDSPVTREQMAAMLFRYVQLSGGDGSLRGDTAAFSDRDTVSPWAAEAMTWAVGAGVMQGSGGALHPTKTATRAESVTLLVRARQSLVG